MTRARGTVKPTAEDYVEKQGVRQEGEKTIYNPTKTLATLCGEVIHNMFDEAFLREYYGKNIPSGLFSNLEDVVNVLMNATLCLCV